MGVGGGAQPAFAFVADGKRYIELPITEAYAFKGAMTVEFWMRAESVAEAMPLSCAQDNGRKVLPAE